MDTRPLCIRPTAATALFLLVCAAFFLHCLGVGLFPDGMESWLGKDQWLMWTASALSVGSALEVPLLSVIARQPGAQR